MSFTALVFSIKMNLRHVLPQNGNSKSFSISLDPNHINSLLGLIIVLCTDWTYLTLTWREISHSKCMWDYPMPLGSSYAHSILLDWIEPNWSLRHLVPVTKYYSLFHGLKVSFQLIGRYCIFTNTWRARIWMSVLR